MGSDDEKDHLVKNDEHAQDEKDEKEKGKEKTPTSPSSWRKKLNFLEYLRNRKEGEDDEDEETSQDEEDKRVIYVGKPDASGKFSGNEINTSKYNVITFLPKNLYEQFSRWANVYFLIISAIALIPSISPINPITTIFPLVFVFGVTAVKEGYEDWKRHKSDKEVNSYKTEVFSVEEGKFKSVQWKDLKVGQIVRIKDGKQIPADIVLLASSEENNVAFMEASRMDGEAGLRRRDPPPQLTALNEEKEIADWISKGVKIECEKPNSKLYSFEGRLTSDFHSNSSAKEDSNNVLPLTTKQLLLRGCILENTDWAIGIVIFSGHDTKTMQNAKDPIFKLSGFERSINKFLLLLLFFTFGIVAFSSLYGGLYGWLHKEKDPWYLKLKSESPLITIGLGLPTFLILYNIVIPISLYVSMEMVKLVLTYFVANDIELYSEESDTPAKPRTSSLIEELGQIGYVFADKTGTLTVNVMKFKKCAFGGKIYKMPETQEDKDTQKSSGKGKEKEEKSRKVSINQHSKNDEKQEEEVDLSTCMKDKKDVDSSSSKEGEKDVSEYIFFLAICNAVLPERDRKDKSKIHYSGNSPDETALVEAANQLGVVLESRTSNGIVINGKEYEILNLLEFTSDRKRMSVIFRDGEGKIKLFCKGADTVIMERLGKQDDQKKEIEQQIKKFALNGYRTLCMGIREIEDGEYNKWEEEYQKAETSLEDRDKKMDEVSGEIEKDLEFFGIAAIEDKLQDEVPETIKILRDAGIKVWVLTGDKMETAYNIAHSASLFDEETMEIIKITSGDKSIKDQISKAKKKLEDKEHTEDENEKEFALIIDGIALTEALKESADELYELAKDCAAVLCCRISPLQKSKVVKMVKKREKLRILAIGDGANDVSMIREAHVGIGISGKEGMQAAMAADYAIAQFKFLFPLLLVHGRWAYQRLSKLVLYFFYKNVTFCLTQLWFMFYNRGSAQTLYDSWSLSMYNILFTSLPILVVAALEQDVPRHQLKNYPQLYQAGIKEQFFNLRHASLWFLEGIIHSLAIFFGVVIFFDGGNIASNGQTFDLWSMGVTAYTAVLITVTLRLATSIRYWTIPSALVLFFSLALWFVWLVVLSLIPPAKSIGPLSSAQNEIYTLTSNLFAQPSFWLCVIILPAMCLLPYETYKYIRRNYRPRDFQIIQEIEKYSLQDDDEERGQRTPLLQRKKSLHSK